jgi:hypothetical protein
MGGMNTSTISNPCSSIVNPIGWVMREDARIED